MNPRTDRCPPSLTVEQARARLAAMRTCRMLVVGDFMLDRYIYGTVERISPEAPVPVVKVTREIHMPGGAGNVAANLRAMGAAVLCAGIVGDDEAGRVLLDQLRQRGADTRLMKSLPSHPTTLKTRIVAERQQVVRVDYDHTPHLTAAQWRSMIAAIVRAAAEADGVILADYGKGALAQEVVDAVLKTARERSIPVGLDPKNPALRVAGITVVTPNRKEAFTFAHRPDPGPTTDPLADAALQEAARWLLRRWSPRHLLITLGPQGMLLVERGRPARHVPTRAREVYDVSGAGDTVIAVAMLALASGADMVEAAEMANYAAGVVVGKMGTATCSPEELLAAVEEDHRACAP